MGKPEKRQQERYSLTAPIKIVCRDETNPTFFQSYSKDISSAGVLIHSCQMPLKPMQKVHLELTLTIGKLKEFFGSSSMVTLKIDGSVIRSRTDGIVIEFDKKYSIVPFDYEDGLDCSVNNA